MTSAWRSIAAAAVVICLLNAGSTQPAHADGLRRGISAHARGDYVRAARELSSPAHRGNARAQAALGFMYEHGFGVPQAYEEAAELYARAAAQGDVSAQCLLGLSYDKGHGVPQDFVLAYKWLALAAAHAPQSQRDYYLRLRDAVASKLTPNQIVDGQRLALFWVPER